MTPEQIVELMRVRGWTKTELAAKLGVTEIAVYQWLKGRRKVSRPCVILMGQFLAAGPDEAAAGAAGPARTPATAAAAAEVGGLLRQRRRRAAAKR